MSKFFNSRGYRECARVVFSALLVCLAGCQQKATITRENFSDSLTTICREKFQARIVCKEAGNTIWVYLPYAMGRQGSATVSEKEQAVKYDLDIEYQIGSFNPYRTVQPAELTFVVQGMLFEIRQLMLRCVNPYTFFVVVNCNIEDPSNLFDEWDIGYIKDIKLFGVGKKLSGEGYNRLVWHAQPLQFSVNEKGEKSKISPSYKDIYGTHINYHDMTMRDFLEKQIKWRIYKKFTIDYNSVPFDLTADEKEAEVHKIVATVLNAYNCNDFVNINLKDSSFLDTHEAYRSYSAEYIKTHPQRGISRKPVF